MSKKVKEVKEEKKEITIDDAIENIKKKLQNYQIMTIKAEGALEVLLQLKGDKENG
tara:strand:+ start:5623 stop:5790 length:168 start_codon:yes stop_codon:yes gene_type:complete